MNTLAAVVFTGFLGLAIGVVAVPRGDYRLRDHRPASAVAPSATASALAHGSEEDVATPSLAASAAPIGDFPVLGEEAEDPASAAGAASGVPALGDAPKSVTFGVVLVTYAGAQGAPRNARSRADAEKLVAELAELARGDFRAAVKKGDAGSTEDAGRMYRGILEPAPEYALFSLEPEKVSAPVDTPRGFWIVRRIK